MLDRCSRVSEGNVWITASLLTLMILTTALIALPASAQKAAPQAITCYTSTDSCTGTLSSLFAISHSYLLPEGQTAYPVLYRVTVRGHPSNTKSPQQGSWSPGTHWGDGNNGFFYRVIVNGDTANPKIYVPFNGVGVGIDGQPALPPFSFIVPVDVSVGSPTLAISACVSML